MPVPPGSTGLNFRAGHLLGLDGGPELASRILTAVSCTVEAPDVGVSRAEVGGSALVSNLVNATVLAVRARPARLTSRAAAVQRFRLQRMGGNVRAIHREYRAV